MAGAGLRKMITAAFLPFAKTYQSMRPGIRIFMYHRVNRSPGYDQLTVSIDRFERQMAHLSANHQVISLEQAVDELQEKNIKSSVVITFDDGYLDNRTHALPVLRKYRIPATFFIASDFADQTIRHPRYPLEKGRLHLIWEEIREMASDPAMTIGSHTLSHPFLTRLSREKARIEIMESRKRIMEKTGGEVHFFCYPSGDFGLREVEWVREAGYRAAVTVAPGANHDFSRSFELSRTEITDKDGPAELDAKISGAFDPIHYLLHWKRQGRFKVQGFRK